MFIVKKKKKHNKKKEKKNNYENFQFIINNTTLEMNSLSQVSSKEKKMKLRNSYGLYRFNASVCHITYATMIIDNYQWYT